MAVVQLPREPAAIASHLEQCWSLDEPLGASSKPTTAEDEARTSLYRELDARRSFVATGGAAAASSMDAFAASLNLRVEMVPVVAANARRAAQLTERANQHNACTVSYTHLTLPTILLV